MKTLPTLIFILTLVFSISAQTKQSVFSKNNVEMVLKDDNATSELVLIPVGFSPTISGAQFSAKYFGPASDADVSFLFVLKGTKNRYSVNKDFAVKILVDNIPLSFSRNRIIDSVNKDGSDEVLHFHLTTEEVAWLALGKKISFELYDMETEAKLDTVFFTLNVMNEYKSFAQSVYLIRSKYK